MNRTIVQLKRLIAGDGVRLIPAILLSIFDSFCNSAFYGVMLFVITDLAKQALTGERLKRYSLVLIAAFVLRCIAQAVGFTKAQTIGPDVSYRLRMDLGNHIRALNLGFFNRNSLGKLTGTLITDVTDFETIITHCLCDAFKAISFTILALLMAFYLDNHFGILVLLLLLLAFPFLLYSGKLSAVHSEKLRNAKQTATNRIVEYVNGMKTFRLYNRTGKNLKSLDDALDSLRRESTHSEIAILPVTLMFSAITAMAVPMSLLLGAWLFTRRTVDATVFLMILLLAVAIYSEMTAISALYPQVCAISKAAENIISVLDEKEMPYQKDAVLGEDLTIEFRKVSFSYGGENVLKNLSFCIPKGTTTALIGPSGSGKTSIASLVSRFWDVQSGEITIGGKNIKDLNPDLIASKVSVVFQDVYLLADTIYNNIRIGKQDASREEVMSAAKAANCHEFIMKTEKGYDTIVGEGGCTLSGGEKQRIAIARAILKDAPIVLLDESTSSLDADNEQEIEKSIDQLMKDKTVLVIAHRLKTIVNADQIIVLNHGEIEESGTHDTLSSTGGWYARMTDRQRKAEQWTVK